jgi:hypothetical protein
VAANTAVATAFHVLLDRYVWPWWSRIEERRADAERGLREELGREPTEEELLERLTAQKPSPAGD